MPKWTPNALLVLLAMILVACSGGKNSVQTSSRTDPGFGPDGAPLPWEQPVPKAQCTPGDRIETGLQGQVPMVDRVSGRSLQGYNCNLELVGQSAGEGASWQMAWFDSCAYYDTAKVIGINTNGTTFRPGQTTPGVAVIDVSDPSAPAPTTQLTTTAMLDPWESLKVHQERKLLAAVDGAGSGGSAYFDIYDLAGDCRAPELLSSSEVGTASGHAGVFSADGLTYYGSDTGTGIRAIDVSEPAQPALVLQGFPQGTHDLSTSADGNRLYNAVVGLGDGATNGLAILDVSEVQARQADPLVEIISEFFWEDGAAAQHTQPITIAGHPYLLFVDEGVSGATAPLFCQRGLPPFAFARLIDIADETSPKTVSKLMLETHDPAHCALTLIDEPGLFNYDSHYCTVDDVNDAKLLACSYFASGLRVFDIRNPYRPREIAYYNPPARPGYQPGSNYNSTGICGSSDWTTAHPRFVLEREEIWFTSQCNGFQVVRFSRPLADLL